jgi:hypothetical protein
MPEHYRIVGASHGEPLPEGSVGVRVRVPLSGCPSRRWSHDLKARLTNELVGHPAVGHLHLDNIVQADQIVLDGVEEREAPLLSHALRRAIDATNAACSTETSPSANVPQPEAEAIAQKLTGD